MVYICLHSLYHCQECADVRLAQAATRGELKDVRQALRALVHGGLLEARLRWGCSCGHARGAAHRHG